MDTYENVKIIVTEENFDDALKKIEKDFMDKIESARKTKTRNLAIFLFLSWLAVCFSFIAGNISGWKSRGEIESKRFIDENLLLEQIDDCSKSLFALRQFTDSELQ